MGRSAPSTLSAAAAALSRLVVVSGLLLLWSSCCVRAEHSSKRLAIITGGTRGIGRGICEALVSSGEYDGFLLTYNTNREAAEAFVEELLADDGTKNNNDIQVELIGGDLSTEEVRNEIFECVDTKFQSYDLATLVHNAGQYLGVTSSNVDGITPGVMKFGDGSLLKEDGKIDLTYMEYYQKLYGIAFIDLCERSLARMKAAFKKAKESGESSYRGSIIGISSPGCNHHFKITPGYDMPGSGKSLMEFSIRLYALEAASYGINCNVVIPGFVRTGAWDKVAEQRGLSADKMLGSMVPKAVPMQEVMDPYHIGDTVRFLAGSGGGKFMTGLSLRVDGGLHLGTKPMR